MPLTEIVPRVYIGNIDDADDVSSLNAAKIGSVLTCGIMFNHWCSKGTPVFSPVVTEECEWREKYREHEDCRGALQVNHLALEVFDSVEVDIKPYIQIGVRYIYSRLALNDGMSILVHCHAGQSRSAAVMAAYLMRRQKEGAAGALSLLKSSYPLAAPNEAFLHQLGELEAARWHLNEESEPSPSVPTAVEPSSSYRCRICGVHVCVAGEVLEHEASERQKNRLFNKSNKGDRWTKYECSSTFVDESAAVANECLKTGELSGPMLCPNKRCNAKIGNFSLVGARCSCGHWQNPSFQLHHARLDVFGPGGMRPVALSAVLPAGVSRAVPVSLSSEFL